jgi:serine/threonine protein kinase
MQSDPSALFQKNLNDDVTKIGLAPGLLLFERFRTVRFLGRGGMGMVWLAKDERTGRDVAMKFMPDIVAGNATALQDMRRETRNGMKLSHQNVVTMFGIVEENESAAIIMEFVNGKNMDVMRRNQPGQVFEAAQIEPYVLQLLDALEYAHEVANIVHRDIKPANLMVDDHDVMKVADFGIARNLKDSVSRISMKFNGAGALAYMSPQQMMGENPTPSDDIYAIGATLYELITGRPPFHTGDIATQLESRVPARMSERRQEFGIRGAPIPEAWETVVAACLEKQLTDRPAGIEAIRQGLRGQKFKRGSGQTTSRRSALSKKGTGLAFAGGTSMAKLVAAAAILISGYGWHLASQQPPVIGPPGVSPPIPTVDLETCRKNVADFKNTAPEEFTSARARKFIWDEVIKTIKSKAVAGDPAWEAVISDAQQQANKAGDEEYAEAATAKLVYSRLFENFSTAKTKATRPDLNASGKMQAWEGFLKELKLADIKTDYIKAHLGLESEAKLEVSKCQSMMISETAATYAIGTAVIEVEKMSDWNAAEKKEIIKRVQTELKKTGTYSGPVDGEQGPLFHDALVAWQKRQQMPASARIDDHVITRLGVDATRPQQVVATNRPSSGGGGGGKSNGGGYSGVAARPASSGIPENIIRWAGAAGALGNARAAWGR